MHDAGHVDDATFNSAGMLLSDSDPYAAWDVVNMPFSTLGGNNLAKRLLYNKGWKGDLDLTNARSMMRFYGYVGP